MTQNSDLQELIDAAQVQGLTLDTDLSEACRTIVANADEAHRHLSQNELKIICRTSGMDPALISHLQDVADQLVSQARAHLLQKQPELVLTGGALYPEERASACWRDCWNFFRVIVYAMACNRACFTHPTGMAALRELYQRMNVPTEGLNIALDQLKLLALEEISASSDQLLINACFQHLSEQLNKTAVKS
ncbi:MAG: phycobilisome polypeptide [Synechococcus sp. MED650]|nr:phycobilisome polypeptide [Synechococcus sp. MED650]